MKRLSVLLAVFLLSAVPVYADGYEFEAGFTLVNLDGAGIDVDLGALYGIAGYRWDHAGNYSSSAEVQILIGVDDDDVFGIFIELEDLAAKNVRQSQSSSDCYIPMVMPLFQDGTTREEAGH